MSKELAVQKELIGKSNFSVSARVAMQLGRESISNSIIAILELVKNSYDADAEKIQIKFYRLDTESAILVIDDDGAGMTPEQLQENWLVLGTNNKYVQQKSKRKGRVLIGEKGLGRLGLDRLCKKTILQTFTKGSSHGTELEIEWDKYENPDIRLETIKHSIYKISKQIIEPNSGKYEKKEFGTRLILEGLKDKWDDSDLKRLKRELSLLVSPFAGLNDFLISVSSSRQLPLFPIFDEEIITSNLLDAAEWVLISQLTYDKAKKVYSVNLEMTSPLGIKFNDSKTWGELFPKDENPSCGPVRFEMYFYPRKESALGFAKIQIEQYLQANQGIRIYRDSFRVMPYGNPSGGGDWLNLAMRRIASPEGVRQTLGRWKVGYNQVVGAVFIDKENNSGLIDQTNREGLVEERPFFDLSKFVLRSIEYFEYQRQLYERSQRKSTRYEEAKKEATSTTDAAKKAVDVLEKTVNNVVQIARNQKSEEAASEIEDALKNSLVVVKSAIQDARIAQTELAEATDEQQREFESQKDTLGNLASLGILATTFGHETLSYINLLKTNVGLLSEGMEEIFSKIVVDDADALKNNINDITHAAKRVEIFADFSLRNVQRDKRERTYVYLDKVITGVFKTFSEELENNRGINIELNFAKKLLPIKAFAIDWESIVLNFITNSVWALENISDDKRKIRVELRLKGQFIELAFADSGRGLEAGSRDRVFEPTFSTKRDKRGNVIGTGMGLAIIENFVKGYGGNVDITSPSDLGGAEFIVRVPVSKSK